jgi:hypothetical protein
MVSEEVGISLHHVRDFSDALLALEGSIVVSSVESVRLVTVYPFCSIGTHAGDLSGHNHRDISAGNSRLYNGKDDGLGKRGIIMDWECAKRHDDQSNSHDVPTVGLLLYQNQLIN